MAEVSGENLTKRFGDVGALTNVSFTVPAGGVLLILGPSGAGKTTLLRLVAGLEEPEEGRVSIGGQVVVEAGGPPAERRGGAVFVPPHKRGVAFVFQRPTLWPQMTARENVALALVGRGLSRRERRRQAGETLAKLGLAGRADAYPGTLSGGEVQRVSLARALVTEPRVLLLDEPLTSLDVTLRAELVRELVALRARFAGPRGGVTILWVSHRDEEALGLADRLLLLRGGAVVESGEPEEVLARPRSVFGARFLTDANILTGRVTAGGRVETVLGELECSSRASVSSDLARGPGETVLVAVPPDGFAASADGAVRGEVVKAEFRGRYFAYAVRVAGETLRVHIAERLRLGDMVTLRLRAAAAVVEER